MNLGSQEQIPSYKLWHGIIRSCVDWEMALGCSAKLAVGISVQPKGTSTEQSGR